MKHAVKGICPSTDNPFLNVIVIFYSFEHCYKYLILLFQPHTWDNASSHTFELVSFLSGEAAEARLFPTNRLTGSSWVPPSECGRYYPSSSLFLITTLHKKNTLGKTNLNFDNSRTFLFSFLKQEVVVGFMVIRLYRKLSFV